MDTPDRPAELNKQRSDQNIKSPMVTDMSTDYKEQRWSF